MSPILGVLGLIVAAIIGFFWRSKTATEGALKENAEVKQVLAEKDKELEVNNTNLKKEEEIRQQLKDDMEKAKNEEVTDDNILDFFNNRK